MKREPDPMEQIDYGIGYKAQNSPQQHMSLKVEGGSLAIAFALLALGGVVVAAIFLPPLIEARSRAAVSAAVAPLQADIASLKTLTYIGERQSKLAEENVSTIRMELAKKGIYTDADHP